jgi:hypothetical protein
MKDKLNDLVNVGLIGTLGRTKVQKGHATTPIYQYNGLALASPSSYGKFNAALYKKYKDRGVFGTFVVDPLRERLDSNTHSRDIQELFHRTKNGR